MRSIPFQQESEIQFMVANKLHHNSKGVQHSHTVQMYMWPMHIFPQCK